MLIRCKIVIVVLTLVILCTIFSGVIGAQELINIPARPAGMGGAYVATINDANAPLWNPAGMEQLEWKALTGTYSRLHWGVENDMLNEGYVAYVHHMGRKGKLGSIGIFGAQFFSDVMSKGTYGLSYAKRLWGKPNSNLFAFGVNARALRIALNESNFEGVEPGDPVLENLSKLTFAIDAGIFFRPTHLFDIGLVVRNINEPDIALSGEVLEEDKEAMSIRGGVKLNLGNFRPSIEMDYTNAKIDENQKISIHAGVEQSFWDAFTLRGGFIQGINDRQDVTIGFGYLKSGEKLKWGFDYGLLYPTNDLGLIATTHKFAFNLFFAPPPILLEDLELVRGKLDIYPVNLYEGNPVEISAKVRNLGEKPARGVKLTAYFQDTLNNWNLIQPVEKIDLKVGEEKEINYSWVPPYKGNYVLYMAIDDAGSRLPDIQGEIREVDEDNNLGMGQFQTFAMPVGQIQPKERTLSVSELKLIQEEEPIIPVIFYQKNSVEIDPLYERMLATVAQRMKTNKNAMLFLRGYYSEGSDDVNDLDSLALRRAENVRDMLLKYGVDPKYVEIERFGYDFGESRSGKPTSQLNTKDQKLQREENRRAELFVSVVGTGEFLTEVMVDDGINSVVEGQLTGTVSQIKYILDHNSEVIIICEGFFTEVTQAAKEIAYTKVSTVARFIKDNLEPSYADRVYFTASHEDWAVPQLVRVYPNAEAIIYRPREGDLVLEDYVLDEDTEQNLVQISASVDAGVDSFAIKIIDQSGAAVRLLAAGRGNIPEGIGWDWRDESGQLLDFDEKYICKLDITDKLGERFVTTSDTMSIEVTKRATRIERLIIVEFLFNQQKPQSKFLESRVEYVAKHLIKRAENTPTTLFALVSGHTDSIGAEYANKRLSQERADRELFNLRRYLIYLLNLESQQELDQWLDQHNVKLTSKGFWETNPYVITVWREGQIDKIEIGDNATPVGRTINRRVLLEMTTEIRKDLTE